MVSADKYHHMCRHEGSCTDVLLIASHDGSAGPQNKAWTSVSEPNGPLHHSTAIGSKCGVGFPSVYPPHLTINTAQKQTGLCVCACLWMQKKKSVQQVKWPCCPQTKKQTLFQLLCWLRQVLLGYWPLEADWAIGKLCKQINSHEGRCRVGSGTRVSV